MLEAFEKQASSTLRQPNVILMKMGKTIIGGYASHGWKISDTKLGDDTCFLFNLTQNFRFSAVTGHEYY